ncbi:MAG: LuxR family transcriptional regulator [Caldilinea sp. CFX5]|nr:LuxR family transcriptional regulator [Caldilinea sp. CFX5]
MSTPILATKLHIPSPRPKVVPRPRLVERLNEGLAIGCKLTLISAPAGFGKTTLVSEWIHQKAEGERRKAEDTLHPSSFILHPSSVAWLSLDERDNDPVRFLTYLVAALQTLPGNIGAGLLSALQAPQLPQDPAGREALLTTLLNEIAAVPDNVVLVLDDYHVIDTAPNGRPPLGAVEKALAFLLDHLPPQMHLVIVTREDPPLPLARLRASGQLTEVRAADLRFTPAEAAGFLNQVMGLNLSVDAIAALETRTEGWIAGLQLAALSMQGLQDTAGFIQSFTGSHHFVLDYLLEEVLQKQPANRQTFLLHTSILDRMCGPLCDAVLRDPTVAGQEMLATLEHDNLFIIPLDNERHWYRYHHLFGDLLRQQLGERLSAAEISQLHIRASEWYEQNNLAFEAFQHATAANDVERAARLIESKQMGLHLHSVAMPILDWLAALPKTVLDARPQLWVRSATLALMAGQTSGVEEKLQAAEKALQDVELDEKSRDLIGQMACARATLALTRYDPETMLTQAQRALVYLHPNNFIFRFTANWALAVAHKNKGDRAAAARACQESIAISQKYGSVFSKNLATTILGELQELDNQLYQAAETYRQVLARAGEHPQPNTETAYLSLARIYYEWNDLAAAEQHAQQSLRLTRLYDRVIDRFLVSEVFLARLKLARGDVDGAAAMLAQTEQAARQQNFTQRLPDIAELQLLTLLRQGQVAAAAQLARHYELPLSQARVLIAQNDPAAALAVLEPLRRQAEEQEWADKRLKTLVLLALAQHIAGEKAQATQLLDEALTLAEPGGFIRLFVDEGEPMAQLLQRMKAEGGRVKAYVHQLLAAFGDEATLHPSALIPHPLVEPLTPRELEVLHLIALGLSNPEIGKRLFLALDTVKGHNRRIFEKLQVQRRIEAITRARELGLL